MKLFRDQFDDVAGLSLLVAGRRIDLETHQPIDAKVQIEVRKFKGLSGRGAVRQNADERAPRRLITALRRLPVRFKKDRVRGARLDAAGL